MTGVFNATNEGVTWGELLAGADVTWVSSDYLAEHGVGEWMELPLWIRDPAWAGMHHAVISRAVNVGLRFRPVSGDTGAAAAPAVEGVGLAPEREAELLAAWRAVKVAYPGREGAQRRRVRAALSGRARTGAALLLRRRRRRRVGHVDAGVLPIELDLRPRRRDARPARRLGDVDQRAGDPPDPALPRRRRRGAAAGDPRRRARTRSRSTSAVVCSQRCRGRRRSQPATADAAAQVADADPTEAAIASERAAALHGLVVLAADVGDHPRRSPASSRSRTGRSSAGAPTGGSPSRSRPTTGRARSTARSSPSPATRSTSSS